MTHRSKSTLFLIEQLIVIAVFAICAVACISILTAAYFNANDSKATSHAILKAESAAEVFKATGGNEHAIMDILGGTHGEKFNYSVRQFYPAVTVYYDSFWQVSSEENASFVLFITFVPSNTGFDRFIMSELSVERITGEELVAFPLAARGALGVNHYG